MHLLGVIENGIGWIAYPYSVQWIGLCHTDEHPQVSLSQGIPVDLVVALQIVLNGHITSHL